MPELIVVEKIDGTPVAWRCSDCRQSFSVRGKFTTKERRKQVSAQFKTHLEESHKAKALAVGAAALAQH
jgi:transposase-like protein